MNRPLTEFYSAGLEKENQGEFAHRYVKAVYELADYLTRSFPDIYFEGCAGGGGRFDIAMLKYFSSVWASDSCDAEERCRIQYGYSYLYPLKTVSSHVGIARPPDFEIDSFGIAVQCFRVRRIRLRAAAGRSPAGGARVYRGL